jgi:hypothetical protein
LKARVRSLEVRASLRKRRPPRRNPRLLLLLTMIMPAMTTTASLTRLWNARIVVLSSLSLLRSKISSSRRDSTTSQFAAKPARTPRRSVWVNPLVEVVVDEVVEEASVIAMEVVAVEEEAPVMLSKEVNATVAALADSLTKVEEGVDEAADAEQEAVVEEEEVIAMVVEVGAVEAEEGVSVTPSNEESATVAAPADSPIKSVLSCGSAVAFI